MVTEPRSPLVAVGDIVTIPERDYLYGVGPLRMRVTHVPKGITLPGLEWVALLGVELGWDGSDRRHRWALVRMAALRAYPPERSPGTGNEGG